jgi:hypothetical protein
MRIKASKTERHVTPSPGRGDDGSNGLDKMFLLHDVLYCKRITTQATLTPDPSPTLRERGEPAPADFSLIPLSRSVGEGSGVRAEELREGYFN